ncbi:MAG: NADH-quinone oxidoreductase subunit NuoG [Caldilineaceae bacterium]|nr:NADH-quinone oxidoreductase subunit NuoG [Caldilineaceae bacterium]MBP8107883.1 NADH-quinone oxidoreductase subunit NuoG [Caldilineaceae bacterium]MBP8122648.1 NADH-quinone oxidoreductase subunit NuoG [Caldilineaceae bacterium]MBP9071050.1 NADH-quinone oxidoreductase subunit NuoG [Caldilineaceae bacterium]
MTDLVNLTIDGKALSVPKGTLVVDAAATINIEIPVFCSHPKLDPVGCCRMCMVEFESPRGVMLNTACTVPVAEGMIVRTNTEQVQTVQQANLGFILLNHPLDCPICDKGGECPLQDQTMRYGNPLSQMVEPKRLKKKHYPISDTIMLDQERCVVCWRCTRYLEEWEDKPQLGLFERGGKTIIDIQPGQEVDSKTSGSIIDICPVGALTNRVSRFAFRPWETERTASICTHCSMGCNLRLDSRTDTLRRIVGRENMAVNDQWICDKGRFAHAWVNHDERLSQPMVRKNGQLVPVTWQEALDTAAAGLKAAKSTHGADAMGGIGSAKLGNESSYIFQRFMRQILGTNNIDHRNGGDITALAPGMTALADVMKPQYGPDPVADVVFLLGLDPSEEIPVLDVHLKRAVRKGGAKLIIAHPRKIELTRYDGPFLNYRPGTEVATINGVTKALLALKKESPANLTDWVDEVSDELLRDMCGVSRKAVKAAAKAILAGKNVLFLYGPLAGSEEAANAFANLALAAGQLKNLGYIGLDANSQGARDMGVLPTQLPGHLSVEDEKARKSLEKLWGAKLPVNVGQTYHQMLDGAGKNIKALYVMGANPATERPTWAARLDQLDFLVVQDLFLTETAALADVVFPAVSWAESDATFTNLERRVQRAPKALTNHNLQGAPDWLILDHLATHFGTDWPFGSAQAILAEIAKAAPIYAKISWDAIGDEGVQWDADAVRPAAVYRQAIQNGIIRSGLPPKADFPLDLVAGTMLYDGGSLFHLTEAMHDMAGAAFVGLNPKDAEKLAVAEGATVNVSSPEGTLTLAVKVDAQVKPGTTWIPESLAGAPVGVLLNGSREQRVRISKE